MNIRQKGMAVALVLASLGGGAVGATVFSASSSSAATTGATGPSGQPGPPGAYGPRTQGGKFVSNENATHEKSESAQREAQETAGQFPTVP